MAGTRDAKALVGDGEGGLELVTTVVDSPGPFEVSVRIRAAGICHTDYDSIATADAPFVLGHEGAGEVVEVGAAVEDLQVGQHVLLTWAIACGRCFQCVRGSAVHCESLGRAHGGAHQGATLLNGSALDRFFHLGTMSTISVVRREALVPLPDFIPFAEAALLGCGVMTGYGSAVNAAGIVPGSSAVVIGCGGVGLNAIQGARIAGATQIIAVDVRSEKFELARRLGATHVVLARSSDAGLLSAAETVRSMTEGRGADYAFECTAIPDLAMSPLAMVRDGGVAVQVSGVEQTIRADMTLFEWNKTYLNPLYGNCQPTVDFPRLFDLYRLGQLQLKPMITRTYALDEYEDAFDDLKNGRNAKGVFLA